MDCTRNESTIKKGLISYFKSLGIDVHTNTKALGHQGFFRRNRIDISKNTKPERVVPVLLHEFAHYVTYSLGAKLFDEKFNEELILVTNFVDENSTFEKLLAQKNSIKESIKYHENIIKQKYPSFKRSQEFKPFNKYARFSDIRYLLKHDAVRVLSWFTFKTYSIMNIREDFEDTPEEFVSYLKLRSYQRKQKSITARINKMQKYYTDSSELFARFVEGLYIDKEYVKQVAPNAYDEFFDNMPQELMQALQIAGVI